MRLPATNTAYKTTNATMLYLEDYLEMIEQLHHDLRHQFQIMHEMDDRVHTDTTEVKEQISEFCVKAKDMAKEQWEEEQTPILERFKKIIEVSEEKVELSTTLHSSVSRYLQRLEKELAKYKSELEADNEGITEVLEQMAMKEPEPPESPKSLKKKTATMYDAAAFDNYSDYDAETPVDTGMETLDEYRMLLADEMNNASNSPQSVVSDLSSDLIGYIRKRKREHDPIPNNIPVTPTEVGGGFKKKRPSVFGPMHHGPPPSGGPATAGPGSANNQLRLNKKLEYQSSAEVFEVDWQYVDPNEPLYCICNQVSYGDMVGCDNPSCPIEWFHYPCVDLHDAPKGKWYCPQCREDKRKK